MQINQSYSISKYVKSLFVGFLTMCSVCFSLATVLPVNAREVSILTVTDFDQTEYDYGPVSIRIDTRKYANQSAKLMFCLKSTYVDFEGQQSSFAYPIIPFVSKIFEDSKILD